MSKHAAINEPNSYSETDRNSWPPVQSGYTGEASILTEDARLGSSLISTSYKSAASEGQSMTRV
jgi:hypothetical protein